MRQQRGDGDIEGEQGQNDLYPAMQARPTNAGPVTEEDLFCIRKMQEIGKRFHASPYYSSRKDAKQVNVVRYSDRHREETGETSLKDCILAIVAGTAGTSKHGHFSAELLDGLLGKARGSAPSSSSSAAAAAAAASSSSSSAAGGEGKGGGGTAAGGERERKRPRANSYTTHTLEKLSQRERASGGREPPKDRAGSIDSAGGSIVEEEEVENDDDYIVDHYGESDNDGGDDDDGEGGAYY